MKNGICEVCGAKNGEKIVAYCSKYNMTVCDKHRRQLLLYGKITDPTKRTIKDGNEIIAHDTYADLIIRNKKNEIKAIAKIDLDDIEKVSQHKWGLITNNNNMQYVLTRINNKQFRLHRFVMNYFGAKDVDHINRDTMDNRKSNLRIVSRSDNRSNNEAKNVYLSKKTGKWYYCFIKYAKQYFKYGFASEADAKKALKERKKAVSNRVNELIDEYNKKKSPYKGVSLCIGDKYEASYCADNRIYKIGRFNTPEEAVEARAAFIEKHNSK